MGQKLPFQGVLKATDLNFWRHFADQHSNPTPLRSALQSVFVIFGQTDAMSPFDLYSFGFQKCLTSWPPATAAVVLVTFLEGIAASSLVGFAVVGALQLGISQFFLLLIRRSTSPKMDVLFDGFQSFDRYIQSLLASLLVGFLIMAGCFLLLVPGIIIGTGLSLTFLILADHPKIQAIEAMEMSWGLVVKQGNFWKVLGFQLLAIPLLMVGFMMFFIGVFFVMPIYYSALAALYDDLIGIDPLPPSISY